MSVAQTFFLAILVAASPRQGETGLESKARPRAGRPGDWRVELLTMGPGEEAYSRFGHSAIRVRNLAGKADLVFNFGTFDDEAPDVVSRFLKGRLRYWLSVDTFEETREEYGKEGRRLWAQELALSGDERRRLVRRLRHLARPENREYRYHPFENNCSTRVRDELDLALGGLLERQLRGKPAATHRQWLRRATLGAPFFHLGFDLVLTRADRPIDRWEACFAPEQLMQGAATLRREVGAGSRPLVTVTRVLLPGPDFSEGGALTPWGLFVAGAMLMAAWILLPPLIRRSSVLAWRLCGAGLVASGLLQVALGAVILILWCSSRLVMFRGNPSLILVPPTAVFWILAGLWTIRHPPCRRAIPGWMVWVGLAHLWGPALYALFRLLQDSPQGNLELLLSSLVMAGASSAVLLMGRVASPGEARAASPSGRPSG